MWILSQAQAHTARSQPRLALPGGTKEKREPGVHGHQHQGQGGASQSHGSSKRTL